MKKFYDITSNYFIGLFTILSILLFSFTTTQATNIRGKIEATSEYLDGRFAVNRAEIIIYQVNNDAEERIGQTTTGIDGFYYFKKIHPSHYRIEVNSPYGKRSILIEVHDMQNQDMPRIILN